MSRKSPTPRAAPTSSPNSTALSCHRRLPPPWSSPPFNRASSVPPYRAPLLRIPRAQHHKGHQPSLLGRRQLHRQRKPGGRSGHAKTRKKRRAIRMLLWRKTATRTDACPLWHLLLFCSRYQLGWGIIGQRRGRHETGSRE